MRGIGTGRFRIRLFAWRCGSAIQPTADAPDLEARHEAFQVALLLVAEIAGAGGCFNFHDRTPRAYSAAAWTTEAVAIDCCAGL